MTHQYPRRLTDLMRRNDAPPSEAEVQRHPHPDNPQLLSPSDAAEFLRQGSRPAIATLAESTRCAWLTSSGDGAYDPLVLNWKGPLDSNYDFVAFAYDKGVGQVVDERWWSSGWQWAEKGSPYTTSWTPYSLSQEDGTNPTALYFIWDAGQDMYMAQAPCTDEAT
jgi:hypothetical protein